MPAGRDSAHDGSHPTGYSHESATGIYFCTSTDIREIHSMAGKKQNMLFHALPLFLGLILFPLNAHAYLDLGSGSYVIQILIASLLGFTFVLKSYYKRLLDFFSNLFAKKDKK
jgi:hypothetical protein